MQAVKVFKIREAPSGNEIKIILATLESTTHAFKQQAERLLKDTIISTHKNTEQSHLETKAIRYNTVNMGQHLSQFGETLVSLPEKIDDLKQNLDYMKDKISKLELASVGWLTSLATHEGIKAQNWMYLHLKEHFYRIQAQEEEEERKFQAIEENERMRYLLQYSEAKLVDRDSRSTPEAFLSTDEVLSALQVPLEAITADLSLAIRQGLQFGPAADSQARWLFNQDRFWTWFASTSSDLVLIEGLPIGQHGAGPCLPAVVRLRKHHS